MSHRQDFPELVAEDCGRAARAIHDGSFELALDQCEGFRIVAGPGELDVEELQRRFEVGWRARPLDAM